MTLKPTRMKPLSLGSIRPTGWLERQLRIQADGLSGTLDEFWPDIAQSRWIGGDAEGWERGPYWLDGIIPLAFLLDDETLTEKAKFWIDKILELQDADGWLGEKWDTKGGEDKSQLDPWPMFIVFKALTQWHEATEDERIIPAMTRAMKRIETELKEKPLTSWAKMRWFELALSVCWLYEKTGEHWLIDLLKLAETQGFEWRKQFAEFPFLEKVSNWTQESHVVNNAMALKEPAIRFRLHGTETEDEVALAQIATLDKYHGQATGVFSGDECLAGLSPSQGTELCAVVEMLFSLENLMATFGDPAFAERWERIAFNALPAAFKPDMCAHQYVQQANQVVVKLSEENVYTTNGSEANLFGLEPNFGCCTANMHQGWPKFASHLWMQTADSPGLTAFSYAPCNLLTTINGVEVEVEVQSSYPFEEQVTILIRTDEPVEFDLNLRIPAWCDEAQVKVQSREIPFEGGSFGTIRKKWKGLTALELSLPMSMSMTTRYNGSVSIEMGPLVYALKIEEDWKLLKGEPPHADWEVYPKSDWNYALAFDPEGGIEIDVTEQEVGENPFSPEGAPVQIMVPGIKVKGWGLEKNAASPPPLEPVGSGKPVTLTLIPYGCTNLRVTEFPVIEV